MAKLTLNLHVNERNALLILSQREKRDPRQQAALIIRDYLQSRGLLVVGNATPTDAAKLAGVPNAVVR